MERGKGEGKSKREVASACFQGEDSQGARHRERGGGSVEGPCSVTLLGGVCKWRGGGGEKKSSGVDFKARDTSCQREGQRCEESPGGKREHVGEEDVSCRRKT